MTFALVGCYNTTNAHGNKFVYQLFNIVSVKPLCENGEEIICADLTETVVCQVINNNKGKRLMWGKLKVSVM